jgi:pyrroloquinoline-quinone synthase
VNPGRIPPGGWDGREGVVGEAIATEAAE